MWSGGRNAGRVRSGDIAGTGDSTTVGAAKAAACCFSTLGWSAGKNRVLANAQTNSQSDCCPCECSPDLSQQSCAASGSGCIIHAAQGRTPTTNMRQAAKTALTSQDFTTSSYAGSPRWSTGRPETTRIPRAVPSSSEPDRLTIRPIVIRLILDREALHTSSGRHEIFSPNVCRLIYRDFKPAFETVDAIVTPVSPSPAVKLGATTS